MSLYRICPHEHSAWKVQRRGLFFWRTVTRYHHDFMFQLPRSFGSALEAEHWIDGCIKDAAEREKERLDTIARKREYPPRRYP